MLTKARSLLASLLILSLVAIQFPLELHAQAMPAPPTGQQLDQLLAPIALYPDSLLAQITSASTNPQEILDVTNWLASNPGLSGDQLTNAAQQQGFDPAFISLVNFPAVLQMMADNIDDYAAIGAAMQSNQAAVSESIQRLRAQAYAAGTLRTTPQQTVVVQSGPQPVYVIQPASPQVVYVPQYNPTVVYTRPSTGAIVATSLISFGVGIGIGALIASHQPWGWGGWGWRWGHGMYYNHVVWTGWHGGYRPPNYWYRPRPVPYASRPGYGGNWGYRPPNYRPPAPARPPYYVKPGPGNRPVYTPPPNRPAPVPRPPANQRPPNNNYRPGYNGTRPAQPGQPAQPPQNQRPPQHQQRPNNPPQGQHTGRPPQGNQQGGRPSAQPRSKEQKNQHQKSDHANGQRGRDQDRPNP